MSNFAIMKTLRNVGCHESTDNIPGRDVIRGLPYGAFIVRGVDTHRHGCWAMAPSLPNIECRAQRKETRRLTWLFKAR